MNEHKPLQIPERVYVERAVQGRRTHERFRTLRAIAELIPLNTDVDGEASGTLTVTDIARRAIVSHGAVRRAFAFWSRQRVVCSRRRAALNGDREIKFERVVIEGILGALAAVPARLPP